MAQDFLDPQTSYRGRMMVGVLNPAAGVAEHNISVGVGLGVVIGLAPRLAVIRRGDA